MVFEELGMTLNRVNIGLLGLGTVGGGTLNVLVRNAAEISRRVGLELRVACAAAKSYDPQQLDGIEDVTIHEDALQVVCDPGVDIVVELIGGYSPAREFVLPEHGLTQDSRRPAGWRVQARKRTQQGRLACPIGAHEPQELLTGQLERHIPHRNQRSELDANILSRE